MTAETVAADNPVVESASIEMRLRRLEELKTSLPEQVRRAAGVESLRTQLAEARLRLEEMENASRDIAVICPSYGRVGQVRYREGETMSTGEIMLRILHSDRRYVVIHVPTKRVNEIAPGTTVDLVFPGDHLFRGRIADLPMMTETPPAEQQSLVTVRVEPIGRLWPDIPIGSQVDVLITERSKEALN